MFSRALSPHGKTDKDIQLYLDVGELVMSIKDLVQEMLAKYSSNEEMLDAWIQWASNPTSKSAGFGLDENYPLITSNMLQRFSINREDAEKCVNALKEESGKLRNSGCSVNDLRNEIIGQAESSRTWCRILKEKLEKSSLDAKRVAYLLITLKSRGFEINYSPYWFRSGLDSLDQFFAYYIAAYGKIYSKSIEDELFRIGLWNKLWYKPVKSSGRIQTVIAPLPTLEELGFNEADFVERKDVKQIIEQLFSDRRFRELEVLDEMSKAPFGFLRFNDEVSSIKEIASICGVYGNVVAISPFLLDQVRDILHAQKQVRIRNFGQKTENILTQFCDALWPECELTSNVEGEQTLWRLDSSVHPRLYIYLAVWLTESDLSRLFHDRSINAIFIVLNQAIPSARRILSSKIVNFRYLELLLPAGDSFRHEKVTGERFGYSDRIIELITKKSVAGLKVSEAPKVIETQVSKTLLVQNPKNENPIPTAAPFESQFLTVLLGTNSKGLVSWVPAQERNWSMSIVGSAGTGKTQILKGILGELQKHAVPYLLFDFRNDYSERGSDTSDFGKLLDLGKISINPLELDASNKPLDQKHQVSDIIDLVYKIGDRQTEYVRQAIQRAYEKRGILNDKPETWKNLYPTFTDVEDALKSMAEEGPSEVRSSIGGIFARLSPIFEYQVFSSTNTVIPFEALIKGQTIVSLGALPNDNLKAIVCEFMLRKLRYFLYSLSESRSPRLFAVIDEAHRLKYEREASAGILLKEGRKYGVGLILATQDPVDFTDLVYNNVGAILSLQLNEPKYAKNVGEKIGVTGDEIKDGLSEKFSAYVRFSNSPGAIKFKIKPYYERI